VKLPWWVPCVGALLLLLIAGGAIAYERKLGYWKAQTEQAQKDAQRWRLEAGRRDTIYVVRRDTVFARAIRYELLRDTLRITDTVQVRNFVRFADSTVHACTEALSSCDSVRAAKDSLIAAQNRVIKGLTKQRPGLFAKIGGKLIPFAGGLIVGALVK
jgi:hypothetical protein